MQQVVTKPRLAGDIFYKTNGVRLILGDSIEVMQSMPDESIDMIFADPPYKLSNGGITCHAGRMVSVNKGEWDKSKGVEADHQFNLAWLSECQRLLKRDGTIWVSGTLHVIFSIGFAMQQLGFKILNDIAWFKPNAAPNLSCRYFAHSHENVLWAAKGTKSKHYFDYQQMKKINQGKQMRSVWPDEWGNGSADVWTIMTPPKGEKLHGKHPTQKPLELLKRVILASTKKGDLILDPFTGSSTTGIAAYQLGRKFVGIDNEKEYLELSIKRFKDLKRT